MQVPPGGGVTSNVGKLRGGADSAQTKKARLVIQSLRPEDRGLYKCRTDFKKSPTKNYKRNLTILGKIFHFFSDELGITEGFYKLRNGRKQCQCN